MRRQPTVLHLDLDAFYAAVEQRDKPSLRGKPVVVGGLGPRGVVATASYEARTFGVGSAMSMAQARALCPHAAFLAGRFTAYREASTVVMGILERLSPVCEPISLDECFVELTAAGDRWDTRRVRAVAAELKAAVHAATGLRASVGAGTSKLVAKIASDLDKPDGLLVIPPGTEVELLAPMPVRRIWSVGPATEARLRQIGVHTIGDLAAGNEDDLVALLGAAHGRLLVRLARAQDTRAVSAHREAKSISVEDTFERDLVDRATLTAVVDRMSSVVAARLREAGLSGRTVTVKARRPDFATLTRSSTLPGPSDEARVIAGAARRLLSAIDTTDGLRLLGVGVSGLTDWAQQDLFDPTGGPTSETVGPDASESTELAARVVGHWVAGQDVHHRKFGSGWVWGAGLGRVTVRFETRESAEPGPVRTFRGDDPDLTPHPA
ncbi:MAG TPA: DNA polymerase IV [Sporichthyaceae bacterium]|nr:DNA polymerase IV [Sporichthyaceae bacterium]